MLHRLFSFGDELFGSTAEFRDWLEIPSPGLGNLRPLRPWCPPNTTSCSTPATKVSRK